MVLRRARVLESVIVRIYEGIARAFARVHVEPGSTAARAVWRTVNAMANAASPSPKDTVTAGGQLIVRKVAGWQLWVWTTADGVVLTLITLTAEPPVTGPTAPPVRPKRSHLRPLPVRRR